MIGSGRRDVQDQAAGELSRIGDAGVGNGGAASLRRHSHPCSPRIAAPASSVVRWGWMSAGNPGVSAGVVGAGRPEQLAANRRLVPTAWPPAPQSRGVIMRCPQPPPGGARVAPHLVIDGTWQPALY